VPIGNGESLSPAKEDPFDYIDQLIALGKERGYLLVEEVNEILPAEVTSPEEINDLLSTFERYGIKLYEDASATKAATIATLEGGESLETEAEQRHASGPPAELDLTPDLLNKTNDPVRIYLREMGTVPLLTREGEVVLAKRIERGRSLVLKNISRSPIVIRELMEVANDLREDTRSIKELVVFDEEELSEEILEKKTRQTLKTLEKIAALYETARKQAKRLERTPKSDKSSHLHAQYSLCRTRIQMSQLARSIELNTRERNR
jgi:RNA polymerase primary sigma factor